MSNEKDPKRFSYSRFKTFQTCPKKHEYIYKELLGSDDNIFLILGKLFHSMLEAHYKGLPLDSIKKEYYDMVDQNKVNTEKDLLDYVFQRYLDYYYAEDYNEDIIGIEDEIEETLEGEDKLVMKIDRIVRKKDSDMIFLRDTKTTIKHLKYTPADVMGNQQLLFYLPYVENKYGMVIDAIEVDEVRLSKLEPVPLTQKGRPSANKQLLGLVLYEDYYNALAEMGLEKADEYQSILEYLEKRGHPLFQRISYQVVDRNIVNSNLMDMQSVYYTTKSGANYRNVSMLCQFCAFQDLCNLDKTFPSDQDREILIRNIKPKE
jgi:hypothetical protein